MTSYLNACDFTVANSNHKIVLHYFDLGLCPPTLKKVPPPMLTRDIAYIRTGSDKTWNHFRVYVRNSWHYSIVQWLVTVIEIHFDKRWSIQDTRYCYEKLSNSGKGLGKPASTSHWV